MKIWLTILGLILVNSVSGTNQPPNIEGDWIRVPLKNEIIGDYNGIRFDADTLYNVSPAIEAIGKYKLKGDTILVENYEQRLFTYKIQKHTSDSLIISSSDSEFKYYSRRLEFDSSLIFNSIFLGLGASPDHRPEFKVRLSRSGKMKFKGSKNCKVKGTNIFSMDKSRLKKIDSLFQWSNINRTIQPELGALTDQMITLTIEYNSNQTKTIKGEYYKMPFRLRGLIWTLFRELRIRELI